MKALHIEIVSIPVADQDRSKAFYQDVLGFEVVSDSPFGEGLRWVSMSPSGDSQSKIALVTWFDTMKPGSAQGHILNVTDVESARAELIEKGVDVKPIVETPWGRFASFADPDGNGWELKSQ